MEVRDQLRGLYSIDSLVPSEWEPDGGSRIDQDTLECMKILTLKASAHRTRPSAAARPLSRAASPRGLVRAYR